MNTVKLIAVALTLAAVNSGLVYANPEYTLDSNVQVAQVSSDTTPVGEKKECCATCPTESKVTSPEKEVRREYPVREWSGRDR